MLGIALTHSVDGSAAHPRAHIAGCVDPDPYTSPGRTAYRKVPVAAVEAFADAAASVGSRENCAAAAQSLADISAGCLPDRAVVDLANTWLPAWELAACGYVQA